MSDTRAAIRELRSLSEKRSTQGLTEQERGRLAELRERLGLPSEPAEARPAGPQPGAVAPPSGPAADAPRTVTAASATAVARPAGPTPVPVFSLPRLETPVTPPRGVEPAPGPVSPPADVRQPVAEPTTQPTLEAAGEPPMDPGLKTQAAAEWTTTLPELEQSAAAEPTTQPVREVAAEPPTDPGLQTQAAAEWTTTLPDLEPPAVAEPTTQPTLEAAAEAPTDPGLQTTLPDLEPLAAAEPTSQPTLEALPDPGATLTPAGADELLAAPEDTAPSLELLPPVEPGAVPPDVALEAAAGGDTGAADAPHRPSLAERIDAVVEASEAEPPPGAEELPWGAVQATPEALAPADLGATPLDVADSGEPGFADAAAPIELSSADVVLLESESGPEPELGGQPEDPVPLAGLYEFVGEQPQDPRALAFDDQGDGPTFAPEDLQATGAELAAEPGTFQPAALETLPELEAEPPPPPPAAPRISVPRPPPGPPPPRPVAAPVAAPEPPAAPEPQRAPAAPPAPVMASRASGAGAGVPPPPPPAAFALGDDGRLVPALSAARPEPPQLNTAFGRSGPFAKGKSLLLTPASLDVMDDAESGPSEPTPPPATDVATGAEVFGGAYLSPTFVEGEHRVVLHTLEGQVRRGTVKDVDLLDPVIRLAQPGRPPEAIAAERVKAIFFMQEPGTAPLSSTGRRIRVAFADGRQIVGFSEDVDAGEQGFFLVPADTRTHTARIYVFRAGVQSINAA